MSSMRLKVLLMAYSRPPRIALRGYAILYGGGGRPNWFANLNLFLATTEMRMTRRDLVGSDAAG